MQNLQSYSTKKENKYIFLQQLYDKVSRKKKKQAQKKHKQKEEKTKKHAYCW